MARPVASVVDPCELLLIFFFFLQSKMDTASLSQSRTWMADSARYRTMILLGCLESFQKRQIGDKAPSNIGCGMRCEYESVIVQLDLVYEYI